MKAHPDAIPLMGLPPVKATAWNHAPPLPCGTSSQSPQPHLEDCTTYYPPSRPTKLDSLDLNLPAKSNRLVSQDTGVIGSQCFPVFAMLLSMISNFRMQAVRASFLGFPAARSRW